MLQSFPRKIPEPFASTWLQMVADDKEEKNAISGQNGRGKKSATAAATATSTSSACVVVKEAKEEITAISEKNTDVSNSVNAVEDKNTDLESSENTDVTSDTKIELDYIAKNKEKFQKKKNDEVEKTLDSDSADWLCDECNAQNFAKLLSGVKRLKCFKCQAVRGSTSSLVKSVAEVSGVVWCSVVWCAKLYCVVVCCLELYFYFVV
jgi:hypothetical protein